MNNAAIAGLVACAAALAPSSSEAQVFTLSKDQMRFMVARLLSGSFRTDTPDAADALAVAICHLHSRKVRALGGAPR